MSNKNELCTSVKSINNDKKLKTVSGIIGQIYFKQKQSSKKRKHILPTYSKEDLIKWLDNDWLFNLLFNNWERCGYITDMKPSIDRINNSHGYSFDNIKIGTWIENKSKEYKLINKGICINDNKNKNYTGAKKIVLKYDMSGKYICDYISISDAAKKNNVKLQNISLCCNGKRNHTGMFKWEFG